MLKDNELVGAIVIYRQEVRAVHRQADRAGAELRRPGRHRHREHAAAQRAARRLLLSSRPRPPRCSRSSASSPGELEPVFERMLENATRICEAQIRHAVASRGRRLSHRGAARHAPPAYRRAWRERHRSSAPRRRWRAVAASASRCKSPTCRTTQAYSNATRSRAPRRARRRPHHHRGADAQGQRAGRRDRHLSPGGPPVHRQADRAGGELRRPGGHRHREHAAAQRTARSRWSSRPRPRRCSRSSSSPGELEPVFRPCWRMLPGICEASSALCGCCEGDGFARRRDARRLPADYIERWRSGPGSTPARSRRCRALVRADSRFTLPTCATDDPIARATRCRYAAVEVAGVRTLLCVPMLKENELIGVITSTARRSGRSPTSRSSWCRTSPRRPSSPSRTRGCSTSCASAPTI